MTSDHFEHEIFTAEDGTELSCYLYMPEGAENLPLMVWEHDQICTSYTSRILFDILQKQGALANRLTIWSDEEMEAFGMPRKFYHGAWVPALENKEMLSWVYDQHK